MSRLIRKFDPLIGPVVRVTVSDPYSSRPEHEMPRWETVDLLLDTGATDTALRDHIIDRLGLSLLGLHGVHGFSGSRDTMQFSADLEIHLDRDVRKEFRDWKLLRFDPKGYDKIHGIIGRDVLAHAQFCIDGPRQEFTLAF